MGEFVDMSYRQFLIFLATLILSGAVFADKITRDGAVELMEECMKQRRENIAPQKNQAIEDCVKKQGRDRDYCETFNRTFGNARPRPGGGRIPGLFWELPVCEEAVAAENYFRMNPSRRSYNAK
jgi:hypothetical protein